jgi:hypothetical protein
MNKTESIKKARLATMDELIQNVLPLFITPIPSRETLRSWFDRAHIPRLKTSPTARRGGGALYYDVEAVKKFLRSCVSSPQAQDIATVGIPE